MTEKYLSSSDFARRIGVSPNTLKRYKIPAPDIQIGITNRPTYGWSVETIDAWNEARPGRGRTPRKKN